MNNTQLKRIADTLEAQSGTSLDVNSTSAGYWKRIAWAVENLAVDFNTANDNESGYMLRAALALETLSGTSGAEENRTYYGVLKRIVDAMEFLSGATYEGSLPWRAVQAGETGITPARLFENGEAGAFYDSSDLSTMYQDSAGTTAAVVDQPVGLVLDKRFGLARGSELVTNGTFDGGTAGWTTNAAGALSLSDGGIKLVNATGGAEGILTQTLPAPVVGKTYEITFDLISSTRPIAVHLYGGARSAVFGGAGPKRFVTVATSTASTFYIGTGDTLLGQELIVDNISIKEIPGNHAIQATAASRPMLRRDSGGRLYLEFDGVDDFLRATFAISQPFDRISAIRQTSWTNGEQIFGGVAANSGVLYQSAVTPELRIFDGANTGVNAEASLGTNRVITERHENANSRLAVDNGAYVTGTSGSTLPGGVIVGTSSLAAGFAHFRLYSLLMRSPALSDAETTMARRFAGARAGVAL